MLGMETIMDERHAELVEKLRQWVKDFCDLDLPTYKQNQYQEYKCEDIFIGKFWKRFE